MTAANRLPHRSDRRAHRRAMSFVEFFGCFSAMVGGVVLGSMYLGVDVKEMVYTGLERAELIEPRTASAETAVATTTIATTDAPQGGAATPTVTAPEPLATTTVEVATAPADKPAEPAPSVSTPSETTTATAAPATTPEPTGAAAFFAREDLITDEQHRVLTLEYWAAIRTCMSDEVCDRIPAVDAEGNWQLFDYLTGRKDGHLKAAAAIAALDPRGVDDHVLAYGEKARAWHEDGGKLFGRAVSLLTDAPTAQLSGPFAQSWQSASTQHRMEARLLVEKEKAVESYLSHAYPAAEAALQAEPAAPGQIPGG
jgi:hypothetical protein